MGQAQSQSMYDPTCEDCYKDMEPQNLKDNVYHKATWPQRANGGIHRPMGTGTAYQYPAGAPGSDNRQLNGAPGKFVPGPNGGLYGQQPIGPSGLGPFPGVVSGRGGSTLGEPAGSQTVPSAPTGSYPTPTGSDITRPDIVPEVQPSQVGRPGFTQYGPGGPMTVGTGTLPTDKRIDQSGTPGFNQYDNRGLLPGTGAGETGRQPEGIGAPLGPENAPGRGGLIRPGEPGYDQYGTRGVLPTGGGGDFTRPGLPGTGSMGRDQLPSRGSSVRPEANDFGNVTPTDTGRGNLQHPDGRSRSTEPIQDSIRSGYLTPIQINRDQNSPSAMYPPPPHGTPGSQGWDLPGGTRPVGGHSGPGNIIGGPFVRGATVVGPPGIVTSDPNGNTYVCCVVNHFGTQGTNLQLGTYNRLIIIFK